MCSLDLNSPAITSHLGNIQGITTRMAGNSANCKSWCIGLVSAILVLSLGEKKISLAWVVSVPILLFYFLDSYYLSIEMQYREHYNNFVNALHDGNVTKKDVFLLNLVGTAVTRWGRMFPKAFCSPSIWPFYIIMIGVFLVLCCYFHCDSVGSVNLPEAPDVLSK